MSIKTIDSFRKWLLLAAAAGCMCLSMRPALSAPILRGDLNGDGKVNVADAVMALQLAIQATSGKPSDQLVGDVSPIPGTGGRGIGDGKISVADATRLLQFAIGLITPADFYGGQNSHVDPNAPFLTIDTSKVGPLFADSPEEREAPVSITISGAEKLSLGGVTLEVQPVVPSPDLTIIRVEAGDLTKGADIVTNPPSLPSNGAKKVRGAFSFAGQASVNGAGEVLRFILRASGSIPSGSKYQLILTFPDFSTEDAQTLPLSKVEATMGKGG